jgi:hypothetical protein
MWRFIIGVSRQILCLAILSVSAVYANIVFVHLGSQIPEYVYVALEQARLFNPQMDIYFIANEEAVKKTAYDFSRDTFKVVLCETLERSNYHQLFNQKSPLDQKYRDGFWRKATERFFYIHELMVSRNLQQVVHIESDNMLYVDIATMSEALSNYKGIGAVFDSDNRCIPSFVYFADKKAIENLVAFMAEHASKGENDMETLASYRSSFPHDYIDNLPLIMPEYVRKYGLINDLKQTSINAAAYTNNFSLFKSIFDGAAFGQYLGGIDPRNGPSKPGFINETCLFKPSRFKFEWRKDEQGRKIPLALLGSSAYKINNLHIHSKRLEDFRS